MSHATQVKRTSRREEWAQVGGGEGRRLLGELDWVRWHLDRLAAARLGGRLDPALEHEYERLCQRERELMEARVLRHEDGYREIDLREPHGSESPHTSA